MRSRTRLQRKCARQTSNYTLTIKKTSTSIAKLMSFFAPSGTHVLKRPTNIYPRRALKCTAAEIMSVSTPPRIYAKARFSIPHIIGEMKI